MAKLYNLARVVTATTGTGTITLGSAVSGYLTFAISGVQDGDTVTYGIKDGNSSEIGTGVYTASGTTLTRTVIKSTNSDTPINLSGSAEVFITPSNRDFFDAGTSMLFFQSAAPTGWTKQTTHNDKAIRLVTGTPGTGGSSPFSTVFAKTGTDNFTPSTANMPAHGHNVPSGNNTGSGGAVAARSTGSSEVNVPSSNAGSGTAHLHTMDIRVQYVDAIICNKD